MSKSDGPVNCARPCRHPFDRANLLIKDLAGKAGIADDRELFRVAVRNREDDDVLLSALSDYLHGQQK